MSLQPPPVEAPNAKNWPRWQQWYLRLRELLGGAAGVVPATSGGTGQHSYSVGDTLYANSTTSLARLTIGTTGYILKSTGTVPAWATAEALTKTDDANVTLTLGGTPGAALINAASITVGWSGQLGLSRGGTAASLTASNGGVVYSTSSALAILSGTATAGQMLRSGASGAPSWSTATYPSASPGAGTFLRGDGTNFVTSTLTLPNSATLTRIPYATGSNAWGDSASLTFDGSKLSVSSAVNDAVAVLANTDTTNGFGVAVRANGSAANRYAFAVQDSTGSADYFRVRTETGLVGAVEFAAIGTTASAANAFLDSGNNNRLLRSTSSIRYKTALEPIGADHARNVITKLAAKAMTYQSKALADGPTRRFYGHTAEDVHETDEKLVHYMGGVPDGVQYERMTVLHNVMLADLESRLQKLEMK